MSSDEQAHTKSSVYVGKYTHVTYFTICNTLPYASVLIDQELALPVDRSQEITASKTALKHRIDFKTFKARPARGSSTLPGYCDEYHYFDFIFFSKPSVVFLV